MQLLDYMREKGLYRERAGLSLVVRRGAFPQNTCQCESESQAANSLPSFVSSIRPLPAQPRGQPHLTATSGVDTGCTCLPRFNGPSDKREQVRFTHGEGRSLLFFSQ